MRALKKIAKWLMWCVVGVAGLLLLVCALAFLPPVQDMVKNRAAAYVSETMGVQLEIERFRMRFPLTLAVENTVVRTPVGDTLLRVDELRAGVAVLPLVVGEVEVRRFTIIGAGVDWADSTRSIRGTVERAELGDLRVRGKKIRVGSVDLEGVGFAMDNLVAVRLGRGRVRDAAVDMAARRVDAGLVRLEEGDCRVSPMPADTVAEDTVAAPPWTVLVRRVELLENSGEYNDRQVSGLHFVADSVYNRGSAISLNIRELEARERSGLWVNGAQGRFAMDSTAVRLDGFLVTTDDGSRVRADASADVSALGFDPAARVVLRLDAQVAAADIERFHRLDALRGRTVTVEADVEGRLNELNINSLRIDIPSCLTLSADGRVGSLADPRNLTGSLRVDGQLVDNQLIRSFLPARIGLPKRMTLKGGIDIRDGLYAPDIRLTADGGHLDVKGRLNLRTEAYNAEIAAAGFPLGALLPTDSLGVATFGVTAAGQGFDPVAPTTVATLAVDARRVDYKGFSYTGITVGARLAEGELTAAVRSANDALNLSLDVAGEVGRGRYAARVTGRITSADLARMGFSATPLAVGGVLEMDVAASPPDIYTANAVFDSVSLVSGTDRYTVERTTVAARADTARVVSTVRSGDIYMVLNAPVALAALTDGFVRAADTLSSQISRRNIRFAAVEKAMPVFNLNLQMGRRNVAYRMLSRGGMGFGTVSLTAYKGDTTALRVRALATSFHAAGLLLDTLNMGLRSRGDRLNYTVRLANRPGNIEQLALIYLHGSVVADSLRANFSQRNRAGERGFSFGVAAVLSDSMVRASLVPEAGGRRMRGTARTDSLTFAYETWGVNNDNYVEWHYDRSLRANLDLQSRPVEGGQRRRVTARTTGIPGLIQLNVSRLDVARTLDLLPVPPPAEGTVDVDAVVGLGTGTMGVNGMAAARSIVWDGRRVGDVVARVATRSDGGGGWLVDSARVTVNDRPSLLLSGRYGAQGMDFDVAVPGFPLDAVNAFLPADIAALAGVFKASATVKGTPAAPKIDGTLSFADGRLTVPMAGTTFGISGQQVRVTGNRVRLRSFGLTSPNNRLLALDGTVDITGMTDMTAALTLSATNFQVVDAPRNRGSQIYGSAAVDADMTLRGPLTDLVIRGDVKLLRTTNVVYTMLDSPVSVEESKEEIVTFVPFSDSIAMEMQQLRRRVRKGGVDMQLGIGIEDEARATVNLSDNGNDRIELRGGGDLALTLNTQGDMRLMGRYAISGGTVVYNPPIPTVTQKNFTVADNSYVAWTGVPYAPEFNISASQTVRTVVTEAGSGLSRGVDFLISVRITGTIARMQPVFDLSAPGDLAIQNELAALEPEQRAAQAMELMIRNTYTGPGTTATADTGGAINSFIARELNQWARNTLRGVDLSFGIRSSGTERGNGHTDYSYKVSKNLFNDRVKVTVGGSVSDRASAEDNMREHFFGDVSLEYRLARWDNMYLKAYRNTTRESILEGEVVETGGGFLYRKKMERLRDLFRLNRNPERREARREVRHDERRVWRDSTQRDSMRAVWRARRDSLGLDSVQWRARRDSIRGAAGRSQRGQDERQ